MSTRDPVVDAIVRDIEAYLGRNPNAADSMDGIRLWWLARESAAVSPEQMHVAIERLLANGRIERRQLPDGRAVYAKAVPNRGRSS